MKRFDDLFFPVVGQIAFSLYQTHGSFFFVQFGAPHLRLREPIEPKPGASEKSQIVLRRRRVHVIGTWSLFVQDCNWTLENEQKSVCQGDAPTDMETQFRGVEGQYLVSASLIEATKTCVLKFDLGGCLTLWPRTHKAATLDAAEDQWRLYFLDGSSVGYTNDGSLVSESVADSGNAGGK